MMALRQRAGHDFQGLSSLWIGALFQEGLVFREKETGSCYISFGHVHFCCLMWRLKPLSAPCQNLGAVLVFPVLPHQVS